MADFGSSLASILQVPGLQELLNQSITQQRQLQPLKTAVNQQAMNMLPNSAFPGQPMSGLGTRQNLSQIPAANFTTPAPGTDWGNVLGNIAGAGGIGAAVARALGSGSGGNLPIQQLIDKLKGLFGKKSNGNAPGNTFPNGIPIDPEAPANALSNPWPNVGTNYPPDSLPQPTPNVTTDYTFPNFPYSGYDTTNPSASGDPFAGVGTFSPGPF